MNEEEIKLLLLISQKLSDEFIKHNSYQYKENTLEYFFVPDQGYVALESEGIMTYHRHVLRKLDELLESVNAVASLTNSALKSNIMDKIHSVKEQYVNYEGCEDIVVYYRNVLKKIVEEVIFYNEPLMVNIDHQNQDALKSIQIIEAMNQFLRSVYVFTVGASSGDEWNEMQFSPETNIDDNYTSDEALVDHVCKLYSYCYGIHEKDDVFVLLDGKVSIWKKEILNE